MLKVRHLSQALVLFEKVLNSLIRQNIVVSVLLQTPKKTTVEFQRYQIDFHL